MPGRGGGLGTGWDRQDSRWEVDVGSDTARAGLAGQSLRVHTIILARSAGVAAKVGAGVAAVAVLSLQLGVGSRAHVGVADEHTEALFTERGPTN